MRGWLLPLAGAALASPGVAGAQQTEVGADVALTGGYSNNPFAELGDNTGSGFAALDVTPQVRLLNERSTFTLSGQAHLQEYTNRYPLTDSYRINLDYRGRPSARLSTFAHLDLSSAVLGADDQYVVGSGINLTSPIGTPTTGIGNGTNPGAGSTGSTVGGVTGLPSTETGPLLSDIGLLGTRDRRRALYATAGGTDALSAHDSLSLSAFVDLTRYSLFGDRSDYDGYGGTLGYSRQVSASLNVGLQGSAAQYNYRGLLGTTDVYSIQATANGRLSQYWTLNGALGVSIIRTDAEGTGDRASLSGNVALCRQDTYNTECVQASRQARATGFNGPQYVTSVGANWRHRLSERTNLTLDGTYINEGGLVNLNGLQNQYLRFSATYDRQLRQRLRMLVSARYRQIYGGVSGQAADFGGQIGVSYHFGDMR